MKTEIRCNARVRELLKELDVVMAQFHEATAKLASSSCSDRDAVDIGAARELLRRIIVSLAYRINKASKGEDA